MMLKAVTRLHIVIIDLIMPVNTCTINCRLQMDFKEITISQSARSRQLCLLFINRV